MVIFLAVVGWVESEFVKNLFEKYICRVRTAHQPLKAPCRGGRCVVTSKPHGLKPQRGGRCTTSSRQKHEIPLLRMAKNGYWHLLFSTGSNGRFLSRCFRVFTLPEATKILVKSNINRTFYRHETSSIIRVRFPCIHSLDRLLFGQSSHYYLPTLAGCMTV